MPGMFVLPFVVVRQSGVMPALSRLSGIGAISLNKPALPISETADMVDPELRDGLRVTVKAV
jgi:hypothetical protein